jgi:hypothetical protein
MVPDQSINKILNLSTQPSEYDYFVSLYQPLINLSATDAATHLKSVLLQSLRAHPRLTTLTQLHGKFINYVESSIKPLTLKSAGIAGFFAINALAIEKAKDKSGELSKHIGEILIKLEVEPIEKVYLGKTFDLLPLLEVFSQQHTALILLMENQASHIMSWHDHQLNEVDQINNIYNDPTAKEYIQAYRPTHSGAIIHGTGSENVARRQISANKALLADVEKALKKHAVNHSWQHLILFVSPNFLPYIKDWAQNDLSPLLKLPPVIIDKVISQPSDLAKELPALLKSKVQQDTLAELKRYQEANMLAQGWQDVTTAVREFRVKTLFIDPQTTKRGYLLADMPYTYPIGESRKVINLAPWLVKHVLSGGGEVIPSSLSMVKEAAVLAELRYLKPEIDSTPQAR